MAAPSITLLADAPMLSRDDIDYLHELADGGVAPATTPTGFRPMRATWATCRRRSS